MGNSSSRNKNTVRINTHVDIMVENEVEIYTTPTCPYCKKAKELLNMKNVKYTEYNVNESRNVYNEMLSRSNGSKTVPQIFINNEHIGGYDDIQYLEDRGRLDNLLN